MALAMIQIDTIEAGQRLRAISEAQVVALMDSIGDVGLLNPITVHPRSVIRSGTSVDGYGLIAGAHRLEAYNRLGLVEIPAQVVELSDLERQIAECDENLCGTKLTPSEKALFTRRRQQAYEALHPETKNGVNQHSSLRKVCEPSADRFTADTAVKTGQSERIVQLNSERGKKISEKALDTLRGTSLDTGVYLDKLKAVPADEQVKRVKADLEAAKTGVQRRYAAKTADDPLNDLESKELQVRALMAAWNKAGKEAREEFLSRIDTPIMDRRFA